MQWRDPTSIHPALAAGIAAVDGVSPLTVRSQLKSIFAKTDTRRPAEVVSKLSAGVL
ncbi:hypothetical protein [Inquilinus limosus]|uniref:hypothetical protein n=1 Tax=Inquilinus limosus TaxID=171674 RepID=UPI0015C68938|nr:hypothetical protein [Inquilinus limosus]